jgi:CubicO group peptidase (beta-lactamase class C family)
MSESHLPTMTTVTDPDPLGIDAEKLDELRNRVRREVDAGLLPSCQFALARDGKLAAFESFGNADTDTRYTIYSAIKAVVASAVWHLIAAGDLDVSRRVVDYIPEFGTNGKDTVTVEQVMLHTSGFPRAPINPRVWGDRDERLAAFARWRLNWEPGTAYEYHATSAHWVLAELIERTAGQDYRDFVDDQVTRPLGLPRILWIDPSDQDGIAALELRGEPPTPDELELVFGVRELPVTEVTDDALLLFNQAEVRAVGVPGGGGVASAATMALFYQALLHNPSELWDVDVLADATGTVRNSFPDPLLGAPANRGLGVIIAGDDGKSNLRGFGHTQLPRTFGHNGAAGQLAWADPESGLSFCYLTNGRDRHPIREARRSVGITSRAALCAT